MRAVRIFIFVVLSFLLCNCEGCSKSSQKFKNRNHTTNGRKYQSREKPQKRGRTIIKMKKRNGVYIIPVEINGSKMDFIFDTGAGLISISKTEALFLIKQGTLTEDDIVGKATFSDANGDISEGTIINLKSVKIGNVVLKNVEASVVNNLRAPLLLGQSVFEKFNKVSIDYNKGEISLE